MKEQGIRRFRRKFKQSVDAKWGSRRCKIFCIYSKTAKGFRKPAQKSENPMHSQYSMLCDVESSRIVKANDFFITKPNLSNGRAESKLSVMLKHFPEMILDPEVIAKFQAGQKWGHWGENRTYCWSSWTRSSSFNKRLFNYILERTILTLKNWKVTPY